MTLSHGHSQGPLSSHPYHDNCLPNISCLSETFTILKNVVLYLQTHICFQTLTIVNNHFLLIHSTSASRSKWIIINCNWHHHHLWMFSDVVLQCVCESEECDKSDISLSRISTKFHPICKFSADEADFQIKQRHKLNCTLLNMFIWLKSIKLTSGKFIKSWRFLYGSSSINSGKKENCAKIRCQQVCWTMHCNKPVQTMVMDYETHFS